LKELHPELGGFGLKGLVLCGCLEVKEHYFGGDRERISQWWARCCMQQEVILPPVNFLWNSLHSMFWLNHGVKVGGYTRVPK